MFTTVATLNYTRRCELAVRPRKWNSLNLVVSRLTSVQSGIHIYSDRRRPPFLRIGDRRREIRRGRRDTSHRFNKVAGQRTVYVEEGRGGLQKLFLKIETALIEKL